MFYELEINDKVYKLKLTTMNIVSLEKVIKCNPLSIFGNGEQIPEITTMVAILWASLQQYQHGIGMQDAYKLFDEYLEKHTATDFISVILEIYKVSGLMASTKEDDSKNV
jgi:hypothetical protein